MDGIAEQSGEGGPAPAGDRVLPVVSPCLGDFIAKEKAEVYLLMDFLSGHAAVRLREQKISLLKRPDDLANGVAMLIERPLIDVVCDVRWPASASSRSDAADAAILLKARDVLSEIAAPVSGASIAFTTFVTNAMSKALPNGRGHHAAADLRQRAIVENAFIAYPDYQKLAEDFNKRRAWVAFLLPPCLLFTVLASLLLSYFSVCASPSLGGCPVADHSRVVKVLQEQGLPVFYGLVGALAGVLRGVQKNIGASLLMPRDRMTIVIQLWLGAVMGATIGLFSLDSTGTGIAATGVTAIASPALSFAAGLGVDSVFQWLETLIKAVFGRRTDGK